MKNLPINYVITFESVNEDHYDRVCDRLSNATLDAFPMEDHNSKVVCETAVTTDFCREMEAV
jgi:S-adenosylmethionine synthetase